MGDSGRASCPLPRESGRKQEARVDGRAAVRASRSRSTLTWVSGPLTSRALSEKRARLERDSRGWPGPSAGASSRPRGERSSRRRASWASPPGHCTSRASATSCIAGGTAGDAAVCRWRARRQHLFSSCAANRIRGDGANATGSGVPAVLLFQSDACSPLTAATAACHMSVQKGSCRHALKRASARMALAMLRRA